MFIWDVCGISGTIIAFVAFLLTYGVIFFTLTKISHRRLTYFYVSGGALLALVGILFYSIPTLIFSTIITIVAVTISLFVNIGDLRKFIANPFKKQVAKPANFGVEKIFDRKALYEKIFDTVKSLSASRTGAIITFEKNTSLKEIIKNGIPVHAPVSQELLETIFFEGTRLHDGAVVIHGNEIVAASVYFSPTTKPFAGKYGARHRAAIGISEVCDAVTVVVSEETGRISFAVNGELESTNLDNFLRVFENYMDYNEEE